MPSYAGEPEPEAPPHANAESAAAVTEAPAFQQTPSADKVTAEYSLDEALGADKDESENEETRKPSPVQKKPSLMSMLRMSSAAAASAVEDVRRVSNEHSKRLSIAGEKSEGHALETSSNMRARNVLNHFGRVTNIRKSRESKERVATWQRAHRKVSAATAVADAGKDREERRNGRFALWQKAEQKVTKTVNVLRAVAYAGQSREEDAKQRVGALHILQNQIKRLKNAFALQLNEDDCSKAVESLKKLEAM